SENGQCGELGSASVAVLSGDGSYTYAWSNDSTTASISGLVDGTYSVVVTDNLTGCSDSCSVSIENEPQLTAECTGQDGLCGESASATVTPAGGASPFSYLWSNGATTATISGLGAGTYSVVVTDANGCFDDCEVTIEPSITPLVDIVCDFDPTQLLNGDGSVSNATGCYSFGYAFWTNNLLSAYDVNAHWSIVDGSFVENPSGSAFFTGSFVNNEDPNLSFDFNVVFGGRTYTAPPLSPKETGGPCSEDVDNTDWYYYTSTNGTLIGTGDLAGAVVNLTRMGPSFQIGTGANENDMNVYGASGWMDVEIVSNPTNGLAFTENSGHSDFNLTLPLGPQLGDIPSCLTICEGESVELFAVALPTGGSYTYLWSNGATTQSIVVSPGVSTEYFVTISSGSCSNMATVTVTVEDCSIEYDCEDLQANIGDTCNDEDPNTENDMITDNCECAGTIIYDCPALQANIGDSCDDGNADTENDVVGADCGCAGTIIYDCPALQANIGD
ncbi:hypothetical protein G3O08_20625, partial [Cryomorpha ignava]|nr:hypothetical protein [Cryomorpha ignava]